MGRNTEILDLSDASKYLKISKNTVYYLTSKKRLPFFKVGRQLRFRKSAIDNWAEKQENKNNI